MVPFYDPETYRGLTGQQQAPGPSDYPSQWPALVRDCKGMYHKCLYKRCATQCEEILQEQGGKLHPVHETFLHFYVAICYESLGEAAHRFSSRRLPLLNQAKDAFIAALASLPKPVAGSPGHGDEDAVAVVDEQATAPSRVVNSSAPLSRTERPADEHCDSGYDSTSESSSPPPLPPPMSSLQEKNNTSHHSFNSADGVGHGTLIPKPLFTTKTHDQQQQPTPPKPSPSLPPINNSSNYTTLLHDLLLSKHLPTITNTIATTTSQQLHHRNRRLDQTNRFASFWSFDAAVADHDQPGTGTGMRARDRNRNNHGSMDERVARLRREGWLVRKERVGWMGQGYYDRLREEVERDLCG